MKLMYITNDPHIATYAESCGVQRIFVDMEYIGKDERQGHLDTHKAKHTPADVKRVKGVLQKAEVMVRINPIYDGTANEVEDVIKAGADVIMLPMFKTVAEIDTLVGLVNKRARICLLLETPQALARLDSILERAADLDEIHLGLNDLHLAMQLDFMFELLSGGLVEYVAGAVKAKGLIFGFGGIACIGGGAIPAELILSEHIRLGSEMVILSRTFHHNARSLDDLKNKIDLKKEIDLLQDTCIKYSQVNSSTLLQNRQLLKAAISKLKKS